MAKNEQNKIPEKPERITVFVPKGGTYSFPPLCPCCSAPAETSRRISATVPYGATSMQKVSIEIPICRRCKKHIRNWGLFSFSLFFMVFVGIVFFVSPLRWLGVGILAISISLIASYSKLKSRWIKSHPDHGLPDSAPVGIFPGELSLEFFFWNKKYAEMFARLNGGRFKK
jgi:hypothetical protein